MKNENMAKSPSPRNLGSKRFIRALCAFIEAIFIYLFVLQMIGLVQSLALDGKPLIIYTLLYTVTDLLLLFSIFGIAAVAFNYCPKKANTRMYFLVIYSIEIATILSIVAFYVYAIISNQQTLQSLVTENIIDENNVLLTYIAQVERNIALCWWNFGLSLFCLLPLGGIIATHQLRIKNGVNIYTR